MRQIVAIGGGGFSMEPDNPLLDQYVIEATGKPSPRLCFLPTASGDSAAYAARFHRAFRRWTKRTSVLTLKSPATASLTIQETILAQDAIYVGGGDTATMLAAWRAAGIDRALLAAYEQGVVLAGLSAGAMCWFEWGMDDPEPSRFVPLAGLGLLKGSCTAHYDVNPEQRAAFHRHVARGSLPPGHAVGDGVALHFIDGRLHRLVSSRPGARAWRVEPAIAARHPAELVSEVELAAEYLGGKGLVIRRAATSDAKGILAAHERSVRELAASDYSPEQIAAWTADTPGASPRLRLLEEQMVSDMLWVIEADGQVEGFVHLRTPLETAPEGYLHALYLTPTVAGRGLARKLMAQVEIEARMQGLPGLRLHSSRTALGFYAALGFRRVGSPMLHLVNGVGIECFPMVKTLRLPRRP